MSRFWPFRRASAPVPPAAAAEVDDAFCSPEFRPFPAGDGLTFLYDPALGTGRLLPASVAEAVRRCREFRPLTEHAERRCRELGVDPEDAASLRGHLEESGALIAWSDLADRCRRQRGGEPRGRITCLALLTADRPRLLQRALDGYLANAAAFGRTPDVVVADESAQPGHRQHVRQLLREAAVRHGVPVFHADSVAREAFVAPLARTAGVPAEVVRFALFDVHGCGMTAGAARNALLLHAAGEMLFSADDDTVCRPFAAPEPGHDLRVVAVDDPTEFWFYPDLDAALSAWRATDVDILGLHEDLLGHRLDDRVGEALDKGLRPGHVSGRFSSPLRAGRGRVRVTLNGLLGDPGMGSARHLLTLEGDSRARLLASPSTYEAALGRGAIARGVRGPTITNGAFCMSTFLGLDARDLLPPFFPVRRNEDGLFGLTLRACAPDALVGFLPHALLHDPPGTRTFPPLASTPATLSHVLGACIAGFDHPACTDPRDALRALGRHLQEFGSERPGPFEDRLRLALWRQAASQVESLEAALHSADGAPERWTADVERTLEALRASVVHPEYVVPADLAEGRGAAEARALTPALVRAFGELLEAWPAMLEGARRLREHGVRPGVPV